MLNAQEISFMSHDIAHNLRSDVDKILLPSFLCQHFCTVFDFKARKQAVQEQATRAVVFCKCRQAAGRTRALDIPCAKERCQQTWVVHKLRAVLHVCLINQMSKAELLVSLNLRLTRSNMRGVGKICSCMKYCSQENEPSQKCFVCMTFDSSLFPQENLFPLQNINQQLTSVLISKVKT